MFDSLTTNERRELHAKLSSACHKFSRVTLCLGDVAIKTLGSTTPLADSVWEARERFKNAGNEAFDLMAEMIGGFPALDITA